MSKRALPHLLFENSYSCVVREIARDSAPRDGSTHLYPPTQWVGSWVGG